MSRRVRLRFAPSPTGPLHIGGMRTALFSYLFARRHHGDFVLRIEDTDRNRYVEGAEEYIVNALEWAGISPDESPSKEGQYGPYRQSDRKQVYQQYAFDLIEKGLAYYAFDSKEEIEEMRERQIESGKPNPKYGQDTRMQMRNSLTLDSDEVQRLIDAKAPFVVRLYVPENRIITVDDMIRGRIEYDSQEMDDKVLLKQDGFPTYHLAVVVDDYLMKISHVFRGEEWLPSSPFHVLLWQSLGWEKHMPQWAHLPLILKPEGNGKLSKRDGDRLGFSVFPIDWKDPETGAVTRGYDTLGFIPAGFDNMLAMLGWHGSGDREIYSMEEMIRNFDIAEVSHSGARFDYQKAVWFNQQHLHALAPEDFSSYCQVQYEKQGWTDEHKKREVPKEIQDRVALLPDIITESVYFFEAPEDVDMSSIKKAWDSSKLEFFEALLKSYEELEEFNESHTENLFKKLMTDKNLKPGAVMLPYRIMLVGAKRGIGVFKITEIIGKEDTLSRIHNVLNKI